MGPSSSAENVDANAGIVIAAKAYFDSQWNQCRVTTEKVLAALNIDPNGTVGRDVILAVLPLEISRRCAEGEHPSIPHEAARFPFMAAEINQKLGTVPNAAEDKVTIDSDSARVADPSSEESTRTSATARGRPLAATVAQQQIVPAKIGRYLLEHQLGQGGFGQVWQAFDTELHRRVAIKILRDERKLKPAGVDELIKEGRRVSSLKHVGIVPIYDVGKIDGSFFLVSELIQGGTLAERIKSGASTEEEAIRLAAAIADALHHAHLKGVIHRDIKPQNILIGEDGLPRLTDFGIAVTEDEQIDEHPGTVGTFAYMSPEQLRGHSHLADPRSDIYSLGVVLYQLLTGRVPYLAKTLDQYREQVLYQEPRPVRSINDRISPRLEQVVLKCLAKRITDRYLTAGDVAAELRKKPSPISVQKSDRSFLVASVCGLMLMAGLFAWVINRPKSETTPTAHKSGTATPTVPQQPTTGASQDDPSKPNQAWIDRMGLEPVALNWPGRRGRAEMSWNSDGRKLMLMSDRPFLVQFGIIPSKGPAKIQIRWERIDRWEAGGLFWDYQEFDDGKSIFATVRTLRQYNVPVKEGQNEILLYHLSNTRSILQPEQAYLQDVERRMTPIAPSNGHSKDFEMSFVDGQLAAIHQDGQLLSALLEAPTLVVPISGTRLPSKSKTGIAWGGMTDEGSAYFSLIDHDETQDSPEN